MAKKPDSFWEKQVKKAAETPIPKPKIGYQPVESEILRQQGDLVRGGPVEIDTDLRSTNPERPRCIACGYDAPTRTLAVEFREGAVYNYYDVSPAEARQFRNSASPGKFIDRRLKGKPYGPA